MTRSIVVACAAMAALVSHASGTKELYDGDDLAAAVADEAAYDEIILHKGTYPITARIVVDRKMTIRGADGTTPDEVVLQGNLTCGLMQLNVKDSLLAGVTMTKGKLTSNSTTYEYGAAVDVHSASIVSNCIFTANVLGGKGSVGVVVLNAANSVVTHCRFTKNTFSRDVQYGGGIGLAVRGSYNPVYVRNTLIDDNDQTVSSGQPNGGMIGAGGGARIWVVNCTIVNNRVEAGPAALGSYGSGSIVAINTIAVGNTKNGVANVGSASFYNCLTDVVVEGTECAVTNTEVFADYASGDYSLTKNSIAAIDKGNHTRDYDSKASVVLLMDVEATDLAGNDRIMGEEVDIGCYEFDPNERSVVFTVTPDGGMEPINLTFEATPNGLGEEPTYYWDFDGDGTADYITTDAIFTRTFKRGTYPVTLYASNLTAKVGVSYARAEPMVIEKGVAFNPYTTDWFFEPFAEPIKVTLSGDLGDEPKFYWDWDGDGVTDVVTDEPELKHTFAAGSYPITVFASNETTGVGIQVAMDEPLTVLVRPRVTVTASDPEVGITGADIQRTIDAAERGTIVTIPKGKYKTKGVAITVIKEIELRGETGNPEDVILSNNASTNRLLNVDAGSHALVHSMALEDGKGTTAGDTGTYAFCTGVMIAGRSGFNARANGTRPTAGLGGCVSNVVVRGCYCGGNYCDPSTVYLKGTKALFTHSVVSNNSTQTAWNSKLFNVLALFVSSGAKAENLLVCNNTCTKSGSAYPSWLTVPVCVNGAGSVLRFSTIVDNIGGIGAGVNVVSGGCFEYCDIAGGKAFDGGDVLRRNAWTAYSYGENGRVGDNSVAGREAVRTTEAANAAKEEIYSIQTNNAVDVADCLNETTVYATTDELKPIFRKGAWRLPKGSPAIDVVPAKDVSGMPEKDLNGNRRLVNTLYDLGAFELPNPCGLMLLVK